MIDRGSTSAGTLDAPAEPVPPPRRRGRAALIGVLVALVALAAAVTVLLRGGEGPAQPPAAAGVHDELCAAIRTGDADAAAARFTDRIHTPLHELAAAAQQQDRSVAARLLEAKQRVEAALGDGEQHRVLSDLEALEPAVRDALAVTGRITRPCGGQR